MNVQKTKFCVLKSEAKSYAIQACMHPPAVCCVLSWSLKTSRS